MVCNFNCIHNGIFFAMQLRLLPAQSVHVRFSLASVWKGMNTYNEYVLKKHNTANDLWIAVHGKVYDVTEFLAKVRCTARVTVRPNRGNACRSMILNRQFLALDVHVVTLHALSPFSHLYLYCTTTLHTE